MKREDDLSPGEVVTQEVLQTCFFGSAVCEDACAFSLSFSFLDSACPGCLASNLECIIASTLGLILNLSDGWVICICVASYLVLRFYIALAQTKSMPTERRESIYSLATIDTSPYDD